MKNDNGSLLLNFAIAAMLIVLGFTYEPMLGILGALIIVTYVAAQVVEEIRKKKQMKEEQQEWLASPSLAK